jgi:hypothetical protein
VDSANTRAADILEKAADLLETVGHCKGFAVSYEPGTHNVIGYCATGAIAHVAYDNNQVARLDAIGILADRLPEEFQTTMEFAGVVLRQAAPDRIINWNDAYDRQASEVIDLMKETAKDLRNG